MTGHDMGIRPINAGRVGVEVPCYDCDISLSAIRLACPVPRRDTALTKAESILP